MVQRKAARFVYSDWRRTSSPTEMMRQLGWVSLETQRKIASINMLHKIINQELDLPLNILPKISRLQRFNPVYGRVEVYKNFFIPSTINAWNHLPLNIIKIDDHQLFKDKVTTYFS